ncbi:MAG: hypothetical protein CMF24_07710 [Ilumatobacter sp.]|nr:hypothetical protein [Ilumatobacter sp.]
MGVWVQVPSSTQMRVQLTRAHALVNCFFRRSRPADLGFCGRSQRSPVAGLQNRHGLLDVDPASAMKQIFVSTSFGALSAGSSRGRNQPIQTVMDSTVRPLKGRITRRSMSGLIIAVMSVTPLEAMAYPDQIIGGTVPLRMSFLLLLLLGLQTTRISAIAAGWLFLAQGLLSMAASSMLFGLDPNRIAVQTLGYGSILPVCTLLIAPTATRRRWAFSVFCMTVFLGAVRLTPENFGLLAQVIATLLVYGVAVAALETYAARAEIAGKMADIDPLTGLLNRRAALNELAWDVGRVADDESSAAIVLLDLDHFKRVNDTLGHEAGDDTLRHVAHVLSAFVRPTDHVCRWGGEEFLVILPNADEDLARNIAERLRLRLVDVGVTASFGVAAAEAADTVTRWVRRADDAMYVAKHEGRNMVRVARLTDRLMVEQPEAVRTL